MTAATIYVLTDADGVPRYVGETGNTKIRRDQHWYNKQFDAANMPLKHWLRSLPGRDSLQLVELEEVPHEERFEVEAYYTIGFRWAGAELLNMNTGSIPGPESRARMSASKTPEVRARLAARMTGRHVSDETRARISEGVRRHNARKAASNQLAV